MQIIVNMFDNLGIVLVTVMNEWFAIYFLFNFNYFLNMVAFL